MSTKKLLFKIWRLLNYNTFDYSAKCRNYFQLAVNSTQRQTHNKLRCKLIGTTYAVGWRICTGAGPRWIPRTAWGRSVPVRTGWTAWSPRRKGRWARGAGLHSLAARPELQPGPPPAPHCHHRWTCPSWRDPECDPVTTKFNVSVIFNNKTILHFLSKINYKWNNNKIEVMVKIEERNLLETFMLRSTVAPSSQKSVPLRVYLPTASVQVL